jgi:uncharacterized membrane protein YgcG
MVASATFLLAFAAAAQVAADEGWTIQDFHAAITIRNDASLAIRESITADFSTPKHGIFRQVPVLYSYDAQHDRRYDLTVAGVSDGQGSSRQYSVARQGADEVIKIGDPNRTVVGVQRYQIDYTVAGAMNAFHDHDELYWNATGAGWSVPIQRASAMVRFPDGALQRATCFQGAAGSAAGCSETEAADHVDYQASGDLPPGRQLTVVAGLRKGAILEPQALLQPKPKTVKDFFLLTPLAIGLAVVVFFAGLVLLAVNWWTHGRDHAYRSAYYLHQDPAERISPLISHAPVVVEFGPPDGLRPAQVGVLLDERADQKDLTATIVDLAVRGYLGIRELPRRFAHGPDWLLSQRKADGGELMPYEATLLRGLFDGRTEVSVSDLKATFQTPLRSAEVQLYQDSAGRGWFKGDPSTVRSRWRAIALAVEAAAVLAGFVLGSLFGLELVGIALFLVGLLLHVTAQFMPRRTAVGSEMLRKALGFRMYVRTAERYRQQFAEKSGIFTEVLPYAIVFGCVERWARAFSGIDTSAQVASFYSGGGPFEPLLFSSSLLGFSTALGGAIAATPASSGSSGFSGGFSGGGGGGGGGGSW